MQKKKVSLRFMMVNTHQQDDGKHYLYGTIIKHGYVV
jgi:hypothetical protein